MARAHKRCHESNSFMLGLLFITSTLLFAAADDGNVYGDNHRFYFSAPSGWTVDPLSGNSLALAFVFYPDIKEEI